MKTLIKVSIVLMVLSGSVFTTVNSQNTSCNVTVQFTTISEDVGFAPKHVLAVWVESGTNQFIKSLKVMADKRIQYLYTWNVESNGNKVDAVTGATKTSHSGETVTWNGKDVNQTIVPDGEYKIFVEFTEEHAQGPVLIIPFTKKTNDSDSIFADEDNYSNISIAYAVTGSTAIDKTTANSINFGIYPNPVTHESVIGIKVEKETNARLSIYSLTGQKVIDLGNIKLLSGHNSISFNKFNIGNELSNGTYLLRLEYDKEIKVTKLIKQ